MTRRDESRLYGEIWMFNLTEQGYGTSKKEGQIRYLDPSYT